MAIASMMTTPRAAICVDCLRGNRYHQRNLPPACRVEVRHA